MRIAVVQLDAGVSHPEAREQAVRAVENAAARGADLVVLPEYASGWAPVLGPELAEPLDGPFLAALRSAAGRTGTRVVAGAVVPGEGAEPRSTNLAVAVGPDGAVLGSYAKVHLFDAFGTRESEALAPGPADAPPLVLDAPQFRIGVLTCYDLRFPESARRLVDAGATVIAVIAAWASGPGKVEQLRVLARARAIENTAYLVLASQCGPGRAGHSAVIDPLGVVIEEADDDAARILVADLDPEVVESARARIPVLEHRRYAVVPRITQP